MAFGCTNKDCKGLSTYLPGISFLNKRKCCMFTQDLIKRIQLAKSAKSMIICTKQIIIYSLIITRTLLYISFVMIWYTWGKMIYELNTSSPSNLTYYWSALDFWKIEFEKLSLMNLIFCLFPTWFLLLVQPAKIKFKLGKNSSSSNSIYQIWYLKNQVQIFISTCFLKYLVRKI